jgi:hypothetical protein
MTTDLRKELRQLVMESYDKGVADAMKAATAAVQAAVAAEREACADICDQHASIEGIAQQCAAEIRARGNK